MNDANASPVLPLSKYVSFEGNSDDEWMFSIERLERISTRGGEEIEKSVIEGAL